MILGFEMGIQANKGMDLTSKHEGLTKKKGMDQLDQANLEPNQQE